MTQRTQRSMYLLSLIDPDDLCVILNSWPYKRKWAATAIVSSFAFISPISSSMVAPATLHIAAEFKVTNTVVIALMTSVFILGYGAVFVSLDDLSLVNTRLKLLARWLVVKLLCPNAM
jgi:predicted DNA repair protein MutK